MTDTVTTETAVRVPIDPRIRERRIAVRRDEGRRRLRVVAAAAALVCIALLGWLALRSPLLDVDTVEVRGARLADAGDVRAAARVRDGEAMIDVDEGAVAAGVRGVPWVDEVDVRRDWPGTVSITITEREAVASVRAAGGGWMLVDSRGRSLARRPAPQEGLVAVEGGTYAAAPGKEIAAAARGALAVADAVPRDRVAAAPVVAILERGQLELRLAGEGGRPGPIVHLGPPDQLAEKLLAVFTVLDRVDLRGVAAIDVRVPSAPVVTRRS